MANDRGAAFVGVSLDSRQFTREWIRAAISHLLRVHDDIEFFLGDRLLWYNKAANEFTSPAGLDLHFATVRTATRKEELLRFIESEIRRLPEPDRGRAHIASWPRYCDEKFVDVLRKLQIAFAVLPEFRHAVCADVDSHFAVYRDQSSCHEYRKRLSELYVLEETAMILRVTELDGRPFDYYPEEQIGTLKSLYCDKFAQSGLTVESLVGQQRQRVFTALPLGKEGRTDAMSCQLGH
jgi:tRNA-dependent cyclodipeptide synthase